LLPVQYRNVRCSLRHQAAYDARLKLSGSCQAPGSDRSHPSRKLPLAVEVEFIVTDQEAQKLLSLVHREKIPIFYSHIPARFGVIDVNAIEQVLASLPDRHPDLIALQLGYQSQEEKVRGAILAQFPLLSLGISGGRGLLIIAVAPGSAAMEAGLMLGDVIVAIDHHPVSSAEQAVALSEKSKGDEILLRVWSPRRGMHYPLVDNTKRK